MTIMTYNFDRTECLSPFFHYPRPLRVAIEGGVGAGKTSLLEEIKIRKPEWGYVFEPIDTWKNWKGMNYLDRFFSNPTHPGYCLDLQKVVIWSYKHHMMQEATVNVKPAVQLYERSAFSAAKIFSPVNVKCGYLTLKELVEIQKVYKDEIENGLPRRAIPGRAMDGCIYLRTPPEVCAARKLACHDLYEVDADGHVLDMKYASLEHQYHEKYFAMDLDRKYLPPNTMIIDEFLGTFETGEKAAAVIRYVENRRFMNGTTHRMAKDEKPP